GGVVLVVRTMSAPAGGAATEILSVVIDRGRSRIAQPRGPPGLMLDSRQARGGHFDVLRDTASARADTPNSLAVDHDRQTTAKQRQPRLLQEALHCHRWTRGEGVRQILRRSLPPRGRVCLVQGEVDA